MRKILLSIFFSLLVAYSAYAICPAIIGGAGEGEGSSCTASTPGNDNDEVGDLTIETNNVSISKGASYCFLRTADCSGTLAVGYVYNGNGDDSDSKIGVFADDGDSTPDSGDSSIGTSGGINSASIEWATDSSTIGGSVSSGSSYWVCIFVDDSAANNWRAKGAGSTTVYYINGSGHYDTPPSDLTGSWSTLATTGDLSAFVGIE